jgi:cytochrome P450
LLLKGGLVDYDSISEMKYMEAVINEALRMYPPAQHVERLVTQSINYGDLALKKGQVVMVPVYALHHDPDYYPEPERFRPERFYDEAEKKSRDNLAFMPFGAGPRVCLGNRFAMIEIKILLATVLAKFRFERCSKTEVSRHSFLI